MNDIKNVKITITKTRKATMKWKQERQLIKLKEPNKAALKAGHSNPAVVKSS